MKTYQKCPVDWDKIPVRLDLRASSPIAGYTEAHLRKLARENKFPAYKPAGCRKYIVEKEALRQWVDGKWGRPQSA